MSSFKKSLSSKNISKSKIFFVSTLLLTIASVILAASLITINKNNEDNNGSTRIETFVPDSTIEDILVSAEDNYVGASEKEQLENYLAEDSESSFSVKLVDSLVNSSYQKGTGFVSSLTAEEQDSEEIKEFNAYLWALSQPYSMNEVPDLLDNYVAHAKTVHMVPKTE